MSRGGAGPALLLALAGCAPPPAPFPEIAAPPAAVTANAGRRLLAEDQPELALRAYESAIGAAEDRRTRAEAMTGAGIALMRLGRREEAITILETALDLDAEVAPIALNALGVAYHEAGQPERAVAALRRADQLLGGADATVRTNLAMAEAALAARAAEEPALDAFDYDVIQYGHGRWRLVPRESAAAEEERRS